VAHVKPKRIKGKTYYYLVESYRENGKVKKRTLKYLGATPQVPEELRPLLGRPRRRAWQQTLWGRPEPAAAMAEQIEPKTGKEV
jgi:hypothetical protein